MRRSIAVGAVLLASFTLVPSATAHPEVESDPDDTASPFDIGATSSAHTAQALTFSTAAWEDWENVQARCGRGAFSWLLNTKPARGWDFRILVCFRDGRYRGRVLNRNGAFVGRTSCIVRAESSIGARVPRARVAAADGLVYSWAAATRFEGLRDRGPNSGFVRHRPG